MRKRIVVKTDASTSNGNGSGLAFQAIVYDAQGVTQEYSNSKYVDKRLKTTDAETAAVLFALKSLRGIFREKRDDYIKDYLIIVESDCEQTVERVSRFYYEERIDKFIHHFLRFFSDYQSRWIPRETNEAADAMAREAYRKGEEV